MRRDPFFDEYFGEQGTEEGYRAPQKKFVAEKHAFHEASRLMIYVANFRENLERIHCPVLALFGEKDSIVHWRSTIALYEQTLGRDDGSRLTVRTFPACNHNLQRCRTGRSCWPDPTAPASGPPRRPRPVASQHSCLQPVRDRLEVAITRWLGRRGPGFSKATPAAPLRPLVGNPIVSRAGLPLSPGAFGESIGAFR